MTLTNIIFKKLNAILSIFKPKMYLFNSLTKWKVAKSVLLSINIRLLKWMLPHVPQQPVVAIPCRYYLPLTTQNVFLAKNNAIEKYAYSRVWYDFRLFTYLPLHLQPSTKLSALLRLLDAPAPAASVRWLCHHVTSAV
jgi:hypothetical protein